MREHSKLPPSSAARRVACPGSRAMEEKYPNDTESAAAREGTLAHFVAGEYLRRIEKPEAGYLARLKGELCTEIITQEIIDGAKLYAATVDAILGRDNFPEQSLTVEEAINISSINENCWGTPDAWYYKPGHLYVWDYKFGRSPVEVFENWQLIEYAAGILEQIKSRDGVTLEDQFIRVTLCIVQPRAYHLRGPVRKWELWASDLRAYFNILRDAEEQAMRDDAELKPSAQCKYCRARHACPALQKASLDSLEIAFANGADELDNITVGNELRILQKAQEFLKSRISGLEEVATSYLQAGKSVPHYKLDRGQTRVVWKVPVDQVKELGEMLGCDLIKPADVITPKQAEAKGVPAELLAEFSERRAGELKLMRDDGAEEKQAFQFNNNNGE